MVEGEVEVDTGLCESVDGAPWAIPDNQSCVVRVPYMAGLTKYTLVQYASQQLKCD